MNGMQVVANTNIFYLLSGLVVFIAASPVKGVELMEVAHQVSKVPVKRSHIHVAVSDLRFNGVIVTSEQMLQRLHEIKASVVYCEVDKVASMPKGRIEEWATLVLGTGGRFFYKKHRGSIDSGDHCIEYKKPKP